MPTATVTAHPEFVVGPVERRVFGSFVEHMGRCVYEGIYEPGHPTADERGFRGDVLELVKELGVTVVRYPGGNFVSGFRWEDSVGAPEHRPTRLDAAWKATETNQFGLHEFMAWLREVGAEPVMAINLGTRGLSDALDLVEYCNHPGGTELSDRRVRNGAAEPFGIKLWCLGNEMDGPWQLGHLSATDYGKLASRTGQAIKRFDQTLSLVACGSSSRAMPTFGAWEAEVLERSLEHVDYISAHAYYDPSAVDRQSFLCSSVDMDRYIRSAAATTDHVAATKKSDKQIKISFDEWNVWRQSDFGGEDDLEWTDRPRHLIEEEYTVDDAVVVASLLMTLLNHSDRVGLACQAQLVNVIAPIQTEGGGPAWRQSIFAPFALLSRHSRGTVLDLRVTGPSLTTALYGDASALLASATHDPDSGAIVVSLVNRSQTDAIDTRLDLT
ncbi:MAG: alpha-N-arabinofuranosidase, partial [Candidatus Dormibacteraeota bacterium]|nr:alpha-N-arabinofuranosidase [Candidatus Dormibacteraeota bacterium]